MHIYFTCSFTSHQKAVYLARGVCVVYKINNIILVFHPRGKCKVRPFVEIDSVKGYIQKDDAFFYVLGYNPETRYC